MDRREFTGLLGAGALFPADFLKGLAEPPSVTREKSPRIPGTRWYCLGTNEEPLFDASDFGRVHQCLVGKQEWTRRLDAIPRLGYNVFLPPGRWIIVIGNEDRPASAEDCKHFSNQMFWHLKTDWRELTIVTHFNAVPYFMPTKYYNRSRKAPMVIPYAGKASVDARVGEGTLRMFPLTWSNEVSHEKN